jgi:isopenicillin N synthase-like dioxygenase
LKEAASAYFEASERVARQLLRAFSLGLGLPEQAFLAGTNCPLSRGSFVYYPPQPVSLGEEQFGVAPHTDFGVLTVLCQDHVGGLQVQTYDGEWVTADPIPGTLVINVGDLLARWTNDRYRSTPHRVINASGEERLSLVVAYDPDYDTLIDPIMVCKPGQEPKYEPISCGDYLTWRFAKAFGYRQQADVDRS